MNQNVTAIILIVFVLLIFVLYFFRMEMIFKCKLQILHGLSNAITEETERISESKNLSIENKIALLQNLDVKEAYKHYESVNTFLLVIGYINMADFVKKSLDYIRARMWIRQEFERTYQEDLKTNKTGNKKPCLKLV